MPSISIIFLFITFTTLLNGIFAQTVPVLTWKNFDGQSHQLIPSLKIQDESLFQQQIADLTDQFNAKTIVLTVDSYRPEYFKIKLGEQQCYSDIASFPNKYYAPSVINPIRSLRRLNQTSIDVDVLADNELSESVNNEKIIFINIPRQENDQSRAAYDCRINRIAAALNEQYQNEHVVFILTAQRSDEKIISRKVRQAPATTDNKADTQPQKFYNDTNLLVYIDKLTKKPKDAKQDETEFDVDSFSVSNINETGKSLNINIKGGDINIALTLAEWGSYWMLTEVTINEKRALVSDEIYGMNGGSYHCAPRIKLIATENKDFVFIGIKGLQIQLNFGKEPLQGFGPPHDCVGFTSAPIWAGLFIIFLLLIILATGLSWIMDIRTMDRFDDPKGKTITVSATD